MSLNIFNTALVKMLSLTFNNLNIIKFEINLYLVLMRLQHNYTSGQCKSLMVS